MTRSTRKFLAPGLAALALCSTACMVGPKYQRPAMPAPLAYGEALPEGWKEAQPTDGVLRGKWWEAYRDTPLNALEEQVVISNQNVLAAEAQYHAAQAAVRVARAGLSPSIDAGPAITGGRTPSLGSSVGSGLHSVLTLPIDVTYAADLWGSVRRTVAANTAVAQATAAQLENVRLLFHAELASDYFELRGLDSDRQLLEDTSKSYEQFLKLTKDRYDSGVASMGDVAQAQTQWETTRAQLTDLGVQRAQLEHAIAALIGKAPSGFSIPAAPLNSTPPVTPVGLPSALLERRPDIAAAERQVAAANEQIGIAQAARYPAITLSAGGGAESTLAKLISGPGLAWSLGTQFSQNLFDRGKRKAQVSLTEADYQGAVANYRQTVLSAFQQVEDQLAALRILADESAIQDRAVTAAQASLKISTSQYEGGVTSYLQVITSQTISQENQRAAVNIQTRRMVASVALVQALGGGWDTSQLPPG
jgi:NodT family efflux transporter outer membrane factor (OMF) lipoprotein